MNDGLTYGLNFPASDAKKMLEQNSHLQNGVRTWTQLFGNAGLGANAQTGALKSNYTDAIAQAYKANYEANNRVVGAGLSAGATNNVLRQNSLEFQSAYDQAMQNYAKGLAQVQQNYATEFKDIEGGSDENAKNMSSLYDYGLQYAIDELGLYTEEFDKTITEDGKNGKTENVRERDLGLGNYGLDWVYNTTPDDDGNIIKTVKSREELGREMFTEDGQLTDKGRQLYDAVFNGTFQGEKSDGTQLVSFDEWLGGKDAKLRDWYVGADSHNYTFAGTNKGTAQQLMGLNSNKGAYNPKQYADEVKKYDFVENFDVGNSLTQLKKDLDLAAYQHETYNTAEAHIKAVKKINDEIVRIKGEVDSSLAKLKKRTR